MQLPLPPQPSTSALASSLNGSAVPWPHVNGASALPVVQQLPAAAAPIQVLCIARPDDDLPFRDPSRMGHPATLQELRASGAAVEVVRASCSCLGGRLAKEGSVTEIVNERSVSFRAIQTGTVSQLARALTHHRLLAEQALGKKGPVLVLEATSRIPSRFLSMPNGLRTWASEVMQSLALASAGGHEVVLLAPKPSSVATSHQAKGPELAIGYGFTAAGLVQLAARAAALHEVLADADQLLCLISQVLPPLPGQPLLLQAFRPLRSSWTPLLEPAGPPGPPLPLPVPPVCEAGH